MDTPLDEGKARREKQIAAASSMGVAVLLTGAKLAAALLSGSLGLFSEAMHSAMDLVGTGLSYAAVRISNRPPDATHPYGHAKFESLAALVAVALLSVTSLGILREAVERITSGTLVPAPTIYGFGVLVFSIIIDFTRSRYLIRVAREHGSVALEADATHFATDLYGSVAVLVSLTLVWVGTLLRWPSFWLAAADAAAGGVVALIILTVAARLAIRAVNALTDRVPADLVQNVVAAANSTHGRLGETSARVRFVGEQAYADVSIGVPRGLSLERTRAVSDEVVARVRQVVPHADVVVHTLPVAPATESAVEAATVTAARLGLGVHHVRAFKTPDGLRLDMHMEVPSAMTLSAAHEQADRLEQELRAEIPSLSQVQVHIEPRHEEVYEVSDQTTETDIASRIQAAAHSIGATGVHDIEVLASNQGYVLTVHCYMPGDLPVAEAHARTAELEKVIREQVPGVYRVTVHPEPQEHWITYPISSNNKE